MINNHQIKRGVQFSEQTAIHIRIVVCSIFDI